MLTLRSVSVTNFSLCSLISSTQHCQTQIKKKKLRNTQINKRINGNKGIVMLRSLFYSTKSFLMSKIAVEFRNE
jgi:hypothetical protein